jgi:hypothetical protein
MMKFRRRDLSKTQNPRFGEVGPVEEQREGRLQCHESREFSKRAQSFGVYSIQRFDVTYLIAVHVVHDNKVRCQI